MTPEHKEHRNQPRKPKPPSFQEELKAHRIGRLAAMLNDLAFFQQVGTLPHLPPVLKY